MKTSVYLVLKYWRKHKKNFAALIFSGVLLSALVLVVLLLQREAYVRGLEHVQDGQGAFDVIISNSNDEILAKVTEGKSKYTYGYINVIGEMGSSTQRFLYGTLHDEHNLYHLPLKEGRLPKTSSEIALETAAIEALYWVGKCGDTITLDGETYTVTGIIDRHEMGRYGLQTSASYDWYPDHHKLPPIFVGESDKPPLYRVDFLGSYYIGELLPGMDERSKEIDGREAYEGFLNEMIEDDSHWVCSNYDYNNKIGFRGIWTGNAVMENTNFSMFIAYVGIVIAVLSVFSVLKSVFTERAAWMTTLRRIGAGRGVVGRFYAVECAMFTVIQTVVGLLAGLAAYGVMFAYKVNVLGEKPFSGFSTHYIITNNTHDPFLYAVICSIAVSVPAYLLCVLTSKLKNKKLRKSKKPRSLSRCFGRAFARGSVTVIQTAALTFICFSVVMGYLYYTRTNKEDMRIVLNMPFEVEDYYAGDIDMNKEGVAEYYFCSRPTITGLGSMDAGETQQFMSVVTDENKGFGDDVAALLPEGTVSTGSMDYLFLTSDEPLNACGKEIDLSSEDARTAFLYFCSEEYKNFFDEGQLGSKHLYQSPTRLADAGTLSGLSKYVMSGEINIDAINSGKEILITYTESAPPFKAGEKVTLYMTEANTEGYGAGNITSAEVTVGAILKLTDDSPPVLFKAAREEKRNFNFLTTSTGASAMGAPCCAYSEAYAYEEVTGTPFPASAEASVTSLKELKHKIFVNRMRKLGGIVMIFAVMSLLGFAAYFNGIGMKIRAKKYEASVMRAVGTPVSAIRRRLLLGSLKIPLIASAISYGLVRIAQFIMGKLGAWFMEQLYVQQDVSIGIWNHIVNDLGGFDEITITERLELYKEYDAMEDKMRTIRKLFFLDNGMWNPKAEIPALIVFAVLCIVTFILTAAALKKFKRDIAFDLNSGRTRQ